MTLTAIEIQKFNDARRFIGALDPVDDRWCPEDEGRWLFRGHANASWPLLPSAHRDPSKLASTNEEQFRREQSLIRQFGHYLDDQGISFPGWDPVLRTRERRHLSYLELPLEFAIRFPQEDHLPLFALAQHYGVPTRLLDWTESSYIAAYFAAEGVHKSGADEFCVWALNRKLLLEMESLSNIEIDILTAPWSAAPNLRAQRGHFTVHRPLLAKERPVAAPTVESLLRDYAANFEHWFEGKLPSTQPLLRKLVIRSSRASEVLRLLHLHRVSAASIYPGLRGAALAALERNRE